MLNIAPPGVFKDQIKLLYMGKVSQYFKESVAELKKVSWPTPKETRNHTIMVIAISLGVAAFLGAADYLFSWILQLFINR